jgi:hypothetical protein
VPQTYQVFDTTLEKAMPAEYKGTVSVDGITAYRYVENVPATQSGTLSIPGSLVGMKSQTSVTLPEFYEAVNTYWVDPVTGAPVYVENKELLTLRDTGGGNNVLTLFQGDLKMVPATTAGIVSDSKKGHTAIGLVTTVLPLAGVLLGIILIGAGVALTLFMRPEEESERADEQLAAPSAQGFFS